MHLSIPILLLHPLPFFPFFVPPNGSRLFRTFFAACEPFPPIMVIDCFNPDKTNISWEGSPLFSHMWVLNVLWTGTFLTWPVKLLTWILYCPLLIPILGIYSLEIAFGDASLFSPHPTHVGLGDQAAWCGKIPTKPHYSPCQIPWLLEATCNPTPFFTPMVPMPFFPPFLFSTVVPEIQFATTGNYPIETLCGFL